MKNLNMLSMTTPEFNLTQFVIGLFFCIITAFILRSLYVRRSISLSGKFHIGTVIPLVATITFLIIMVVKSSLALSLGLVGALSVIRFRTPIKEPEELAYLFFSIAIGLGYGANQIVPTSLVSVVIFCMIFFFLSRKSVNFENEYNLVVDCNDVSLKIEEIIKVLDPYTDSIQLSKFGIVNNHTSAFFKLILNKEADLDKLASNLRSIDESISFSFNEVRVLQ
jgi:hypothetical protein